MIIATTGKRLTRDELIDLIDGAAKRAPTDLELSEAMILLVDAMVSACPRLTNEELSMLLGSAGILRKLGVVECQRRGGIDPALFSPIGKA